MTDFYILAGLIVALFIALYVMFCALEYQHDTIKQGIMDLKQEIELIKKDLKKEDYLKSGEKNDL